MSWSSSAVVTISLSYLDNVLTLHSWHRQHLFDTLCNQQSSQSLPSRLTWADLSLSSCNYYTYTTTPDITGNQTAGWYVCMLHNTPHASQASILEQSLQLQQVHIINSSKQYKQNCRRSSSQSVFTWSAGMSACCTTYHTYSTIAKNTNRTVICH